MPCEMDIFTNRIAETCLMHLQERTHALLRRTRIAFRRSGWQLPLRSGMRASVFSL